MVSVEEVEYDYGDGSSYAYESSFLSRYDNNGNLLWKERTHHDNDFPEHSVFTNSQGNAYVISTNYDYEEPFTYIEAFDDVGNVIDSFGFSGYPGAEAVVDSGGNIVLVRGGIVTKFSPSGILLWQRTIGSGTASVAVSGSNIYVAGSGGVTRLASSNGNITWIKAFPGQDIAAFGSNVYVRSSNVVRKLDSSGKQLWSKTQGGLSSMVFADMTLDTNGNIHLTGKYNASSINRNVFIRKLNASGTTLWTKTFGSNAYDDARGIATVTGASIYVTGATQGSLAHPFRGGENDGYIVKLSSTGSPIWTR